MKLNQNNLLTIFNCASDFDNATHYAVSAKKALADGTLEIEGYERVQWVKFNPDNPNTFPPTDEEFEFFSISEKYRERHISKLTAFWREGIVRRWIVNVKHRGSEIYWRPLPPPPGKEEAE